jgi:hypothetical protein
VLIGHGIDELHHPRSVHGSLSQQIVDQTVPRGKHGMVVPFVDIERLWKRRRGRRHLLPHHRGESRHDERVDRAQVRHIVPHGPV